MLARRETVRRGGSRRHRLDRRTAARGGRDHGEETAGARSGSDAKQGVLVACVVCIDTMQGLVIMESLSTATAARNRCAAPGVTSIRRRGAGATR